jgi:hypothetical protein
MRCRKVAHFFIPAKLIALNTKINLLFFNQKILNNFCSLFLVRGFLLLRLLALFLVTGSAFNANTAYADTSQLQLLLQKNNCLACHLIGERKYGPMLKEVAEEYAGDSNAIEKLATKIKNGGAGV